MWDILPDRRQSIKLPEQGRSRARCDLARLRFHAYLRLIGQRGLEPVDHGEVIAYETGGRVTAVPRSKSDQFQDVGKHRPSNDPKVLNSVRGYIAEERQSTLGHHRGRLERRRFRVLPWAEPPVGDVVRLAHGHPVTGVLFFDLNDEPSEVGIGLSP
jgi:hypothetical protein